MGKLTDQQIKEIVNKASVFQKFGQSKASPNLEYEDEIFTELFEVTDDLGLARKYVMEASMEVTGIPIQEPFVVDNNDFNSTEVMGIANGNIDSELFNELRARIEYHFNTVGKVSHRRNKIVWKAKPAGPSKLIASANSPEVEFVKSGAATKIKIRQSLKTINKLYAPGIATFIGGFMMLCALIFEVAGNDQSPLIVFSTVLFFASYFYTKFINSRREKKKKNLTELTEVLQQSIERRLKASVLKKNEQPKIQIPEEEAEGLDYIHQEKQKGIKE